ncbi:MAG TPA: GH25 family lysozyme [Actinomycetota bacterium]|nr:GH25 family lysozyme [Actinomycetota bacterium]
MGSPTPIKARRVGADFISVRPIRVAGFVLAATLVTALSLMPALPAVAAPPPMLGGIDVSKWQGTIDWTKVRTSDVRFVIMRATKGVDEVDGSFAANQAGATANHVVVGAYHRATPSAKPGDAVAEADHFVATARNAAGDLVPSLDIEETGGLPPVKLQAWVRTWVERVRERIGVRPLVYASPYFWRVAMGDTQWFAQNGYAMWIAHWGVGVNGVDVPAAGWAGKDWTVWQYTNTGRVNGITTHVDRDHLNGTNLGRVRIARLNVTPSGGGSVSGARITCGGAATRCSRLANPGDQIVLTATPDPGATFLRWTGACAGTSPACTVTTLGSRTASAVFGYPVQVSVGGSGAGTVASSPGGASCATACSVVYPYGRPVTLTARPDSASGFGAWGGDCAGANPATTCVVPVTGPTSVSVRFDAAVELAEAGAGTRFAWARRADPRALGGSYLVERRPGASVSFGFRGGGVVVSTIAGPTMGRARISIDGTSRGTFDGYAATFRAGVLYRFVGLGGGSHEVTITALGTARTGSHGTQVGVDAIRSSGVLHVSPAPGPGTWGSVAASPATDGAYVASDIAGASVQLHFHGTGATWVTAFGPAMGRAQIWVDGRTVRTVGLYAPHVAFGRDITVSGLADRAHTIRIVVLGTHGGASRGSAVAVDGWIVR